MTVDPAAASSTPPVVVRSQFMTAAEAAECRRVLGVHLDEEHDGGDAAGALERARVDEIHRRQRNLMNQRAAFARSEARGER